MLKRIERKIIELPEFLQVMLIIILFIVFITFIFWSFTWLVEFLPWPEILK